MGSDTPRQEGLLHDEGQNRAGLRVDTAFVSSPFHSVGGPCLLPRAMKNVATLNPLLVSSDLVTMSTG